GAVAGRPARRGRLAPARAPAQEAHLPRGAERVPGRGQLPLRAPAHPRRGVPVDPEEPARRPARAVRRLAPAQGGRAGARARGDWWLAPRDTALAHSDT